MANARKAKPAIASPPDTALIIELDTAVDLLSHILPRVNKLKEVQSPGAERPGVLLECAMNNVLYVRACLKARGTEQAGKAEFGFGSVRRRGS